MARTSTQKLPYWQFDVGLFNDLKIVDLNDRYGPLGETIFFRIMSYITDSDGYFAQINDTLILSIYRSVGSKWIKDRKVVSEVIHYCGVCGLFDVNLLTQNVITSPSIQRRWLYAKTKGRAKNFSTAEYWLLDDKKIVDEPVQGVLSSDENKCSNNGDKCNMNSDKCNNNFEDKTREETIRSVCQKTFQKSFPDWKLEADFPPQFDIVKLIEEIQKSDFLQKRKFSVSWLVEHADKIFEGRYRTHVNSAKLGSKSKASKFNYEQREYSAEELNSFYANDD